MSKEEEDAIIDDPVLINEKKLTTFSHRMFLDDSEVFSFSRRPEFSPDGSFFIVPWGVYHTNPKEKDAYYVSYGFTRNNVSEPAFILPSSGSCPLFVRFNPILYERKAEDEPFIDLPYIIVFSVATQDQILIYTTKSLYPYAVIGNIHYAELTDLTWSKDKLLAWSRDGFVTLISFDENELGNPLTKDMLPENISHLFDYLDLLNKPRDEKMIENESPKVVEFTYKSKKLQQTIQQ